MIYLGYNFFKKPNEILFQMNYDWENVSLIDSVGNVDIDSVSFDYFSVKNNFKVNPTVSTNNTYKLGTPKTTYYFRASELEIATDQINFSGVRWINGHPEKYLKSGILEIINLPLKEEGKKTVVTIGDSELIWQEARDLRKKLHLKNQNLLFLGSKKDVNGFAHEASVYITSQEILNNIDQIPAAENYVLFFGAQDKKTDKNLLEQNVCKILEILASRNETKKIITISLPPSNNDDFEKYNIAFNEILKECTASNEKSVLIPLHERLQEESEYLMQDGVHMNEKGYSILVKLLDKSLE
ncbi:Lysophospholipase L1 [Moheibacter sediminis]|uniref:Lysophospholipase L1 n=2 Tax=Moheibacter sediminis TaxID=1434700 RepID=A0A1W1YB18_9FLAO|nr:Lysophospholipase L1 [Moheibacter sediminis]